MGTLCGQLTLTHNTHKSKDELHAPEWLAGEYGHLCGALGSGSNKLVMGTMFLDSLSRMPCGHEKESCSHELINPSPLPNPWVEEDVGSKRLSSFARPCTPLSRIVILNLKIARRFH